MLKVTQALIHQINMTTWQALCCSYKKRDIYKILDAETDLLLGQLVEGITFPILLNVIRLWSYIPLIHTVNQNIHFHLKCRLTVSNYSRLVMYAWVWNLQIHSLYRRSLNVAMVQFVALFSSFNWRPWQISNEHKHRCVYNQHQLQETGSLRHRSN